MNLFKKLFLIPGLLAPLLSTPVEAQDTESVVHSVLFFSPTCPHCHDLIREYMLPLQDEHGDRLVVLGMDISQAWASNLYWDAIRYYKVPEAEWAVPFLVAGEEVLVGGPRIQSRFNELLEEGLAGDGLDLPGYPSFLTFLQENDLLDPRFPDRRIARREGPPPGEAPIPTDTAAVPEPTNEDEAVVEADSVVREEPAPDPDTLHTEDTLPREVEEPAPDSVEAVEATPVEEPESVADPDVVEEIPVPEQVPETDPQAEASPGDTVAAPSEVTSEPAGGEPEPGEGVPSEPPVTEADRTGSTEPAEEAAEQRVDALGLDEAVREMESMTMLDRFNLDRTANSLAVLVLLAMVAVLIFRGYPSRVGGEEWPGWVIPALALVGAGVAAYLSYIEVTQVEATCGPVGDCNAVNQSKYAMLFGILPVGILGLIGYGLILGLWVLRNTGSEATRRKATLGVWGAALFGTLFSIYLTFLEPFVIGATCAWCLTSAVVITLILWAAAPAANRVWVEGT